VTLVERAAAEEEVALEEEEPPGARRASAARAALGSGRAGWERADGAGFARSRPRRRGLDGRGTTPLSAAAAATAAATVAAAA
jgi:hypothetical protein